MHCSHNRHCSDMRYDAADSGHCAYAHVRWDMDADIGQPTTNERELADRAASSSGQLAGYPPTGLLEKFRLMILQICQFGDLLSPSTCGLVVLCLPGGQPYNTRDGNLRELMVVDL
jgi:hypothetical protein